MKNQKGAALIVVLSLLTVSLMVGLSSMQSSQIDERLAGNYRAASQAQMNAESAASKYFSSDASDFDEYDGVNWDSDVEVIFNELEASKADGIDADYVLIKKDGVDRVIARGYSSDGNAARFVEVFITTAGDDFGFPIGMISDGNIDAGNGQSTLIGRAHSNGKLNIKLEDSSQAQLTDGFGTFKDADGNVIRVIEKVPLPGSPPEGDYDQDRVEYLNIIPELQARATINSCSVDISEVPSGAIVYCDEGTMEATSSGDGEVSGTITIVSEGDIRFNGAYGKQGEPVGLAAIAGGDIILHGSRNTDGVFWANGMVRQTGNSTLRGSIVAGGVIDPEGGIKFESVDDIANPNLPGEEDSYVRWVDHG